MNLIGSLKNNLKIITIQASIKIYFATNFIVNSLKIVYRKFIALIQQILVRVS